MKGAEGGGRRDTYSAAGTASLGLAGERGSALGAGRVMHIGSVSGNWKRRFVF